MEKPNKENLPSMQGPAVYRITVVGQVDPSWSNNLEGMNITETASPGGQTNTILVGRLSDQAALSGVLNTLYELHMPVMSMECLESE